MNNKQTNNNMQFDFATLLENSFKKNQSKNNRIVTGKIVGIKNDKAIIDVGLKSEGTLFLSDIKLLKDSNEVKVGDTLEVYIERFEDKFGNPVLSIEKAQKEATWKRLESHLNNGDVIEGTITNRTKGGFAVDLNGTLAFLPGSQVDLSVVRDITPLLNSKQKFKVIKMDRSRNNIVVSRRAVLEDVRSVAKTEVLSKLEDGMIIEGVVKNITDYGVFVDIGGIDGLLHVTDMSWKRIASPSEIVKVGDKVKVQVIKFNKDTGRVSLGMKQLSKTPWDESISEKYKVGEQYTGKIVNITDYGVFVELEECIEGMVYKSELSWVRNVSPAKVVNIGDVVDVKVLEVSPDKHKISLSIKACQPNPCTEFAEEHPVGSKLKGVIKNIKEFGIFVGLTDILDGTVAMRDITWDISYDDELDRNNFVNNSKAKNYEVGQEIEIVVLSIDQNKEIIKLGIKQLTEDPYANALKSIHKDDVVKGKISKATPDGLEVKLDNGLPCLIKRMDIGRNSKKQLTEYSVGDEVEALVINVNPDRRYVLLSIKALDIKTEHDVLKKINSESGKSKLGDVLSDALKK
ncbi:MAG: 30S ribosomal protein S1 [Alphaproteobacteria bacterium]|nr:30S ribosomal protein S1 [Alphaproteobacteria bacterium]